MGMWGKNTWTLGLGEVKKVDGLISRQLTVGLPTNRSRFENTRTHNFSSFDLCSSAGLGAIDARAVETRENTWAVGFDGVEKSTG